MDNPCVICAELKEKRAAIWRMMNQLTPEERKESNPITRTSKKVRAAYDRHKRACNVSKVWIGGRG
jgi:hypothetical protein